MNPLEHQLFLDHQAACKRQEIASARRDQALIAMESARAEYHSATVEHQNAWDAARAAFAALSPLLRAGYTPAEAPETDS
jgi:hypothetical protein